MAEIEVVKKVYELFAQKDIPGIVAMCDENIEWNTWPVSGQDGSIPTFIPLKGASQLPKFFEKLAETADFNRFDIQSIFGSDGKVVADIIEGSTVKATGKPITVRCLHYWEVSPEGKLTRWQLYTDTHACMEACKP